MPVAASIPAVDTMIHSLKIMPAYMTDKCKPSSIALNVFKVKPQQRTPMIIEDVSASSILV